MTTIRETALPNLFHRGKVRDTYDLGDGRLLMVATDRVSAFDVVLPTAIPEKGVVLCQLSAFWFEQTSDIVPNHLVALATARDDLSLSHEVARRAMVVRKAERIDVECVVRGYITGSAWSEYRRQGDGVGPAHAFRTERGRQVSRTIVHPPPPRPRWATTKTSPYSRWRTWSART